MLDVDGNGWKGRTEAHARDPLASCSSAEGQDARTTGQRSIRQTALPYRHRRRVDQLPTALRHMEELTPILLLAPGPLVAPVRLRHEPAGIVLDGVRHDIPAPQRRLQLLVPHPLRQPTTDLLPGFEILRRTDR